MLNFVLIGAAGYVAPRHMKAIKEIGGNLVAAYDPNDSVGVLDSYFPECKFFTDLESLELHLEISSGLIDYVCICSPNHMHLAHIAFGLRVAKNVICEKPLVMNSGELEKVELLEGRYGGRVFTILQLRLHPALIALKERLGTSNDVELTYQTPRGDWYGKSWKADVSKSGGLLMNIGIHLFDVLLWMFGECQEGYKFMLRPQSKMATGVLRLLVGNVQCELSTGGEKAIRKMTVNGEEIDFTNGFTDLHTKSYQEILAGRGFTSKDVAASIALVNSLQN